MIRCESGSEDHILSSLKSIDSITLATGIFGTYDILAKLTANTEENLRDVIVKRIRKIPRIRATYTLIADEKNDFLGKTIEEKAVLDTYMSQAYVLIDCEANKEKDIINNLRAIPEVIDNDVLVTSHQVICNVVAPTYNDISEIVTKKIRRIPGIRGTTTLNVSNQPML